MLNSRKSKNSEKKQKIILIGAGVAAQVICTVLKEDPSVEIHGFAVHEVFITQNIIEGVPVVAIENLLNLYNPKDFFCINGVGYSNLNQNRESIFFEIKSLGYNFLTYAHPSANILSNKIGEGTFIMPGVVIEPYSKVGYNTVIWSNAVVAHHVEIENHCWVASGVVIAGESRIKKNVFLGINSTVIDKIIVGEYSLIGAGALITKDTADAGVFLTRPAEKHRFNSLDYTKFLSL